MTAVKSPKDYKRFSEALKSSDLGKNIKNNVYSMVAGNTLWDIAEAAGYKGSDYTKIVDANPDLDLSDAGFRKLPIGTKFNMPPDYGTQSKMPYLNPQQGLLPFNPKPNTGLAEMDIKYPERPERVHGKPRPIKGGLNILTNNQPKIVGSNFKSKTNQLKDQIAFVKDDRRFNKEMKTYSDIMSVFK